MASIGENLRTFLVNSTALSTFFDSIGGIGVIEQNTVREDAPSPRVWFQRADQRDEVDLSGTGGIIDSRWDIEVHSETSVDEALDITDALKTRLNGYRGTFGNGSILGSFVEDHDDQYLPKGDGSEDGLNIASIQARIIYATT